MIDALTRCEKLTDLDLIYIYIYMFANFFPKKIAATKYSQAMGKASGDK